MGTTYSSPWGCDLEEQPGTVRREAAHSFSDLLDMDGHLGEVLCAKLFKYEVREPGPRGLGGSD